MELLSRVLQDAFFAAIAAVGFAAISQPPRRAFIYCALIAAVGHSCRMVLIDCADCHIVGASLAASFLVGCLAVFLSPLAKMPAETSIFPALLPMIPGMYAYRAFGGLLMCLLNGSESNFNHYFYLFASNGITCLFILLAMAIGATAPIFLFKKISFQATR